MLYSGIEHIALATADTTRLATWYVEVLGFGIAWEDGKKPPAYLMKASAGGMLEIIPSREPLTPAPKRDDPGIRHLAITVADFDAAHADLRQKGVNFISEPASGYGNRVVFFTDCDGNILHIIQRGQVL